MFKEIQGSILNEMFLYRLYNVVAEMCMYRRTLSGIAIYKRVCAMTSIVERRAFNVRLHAIKWQYYCWYAAELNVLAHNFIVCQLILMSTCSLAS